MTIISTSSNQPKAIHTICTLAITGNLIQLQHWPVAKIQFYEVINKDTNQPSIYTCTYIHTYMYIPYRFVHAIET